MVSRLSIFMMASFLSALFGCSGAKSKNENKADIFPPEKFGVLQAQLKGKPIVGSVNRGYADYNMKSDYPWCLIISIGLNLDSLQPNGLPASAEESKIVYEEEDELVAGVKRTTTVHYIGHMFNDGFLHVYLYLDEPKAVHAFLQTQVNKPELKRGITYQINKDLDWRTVQPFMK